ncbi:transcriptional regulator [Georgenia yuyongxinii]|uniref:Transcriptional regulator n=1 Tax=Georgenia yuyongxinii TaxID=2589797 RepID=A0A552WLJ4_9MICO|nr:transcriptional regulator [Georgenia yuyongxinii]TRW43642.1 transcriptional regulator [Georgenia yuyongxinii]
MVALSEVDRRRLAAGELTNEVEALHQGDAPVARPSPTSEQPAGENDARLLRDVPPHWGKR